MLPLIQEEVVQNHSWLTATQFADILSIAEMTPGPVSINTATYVGYQISGFSGSALATLGLVLPSFILISTLASLVLKHKNNPYFQGVSRASSCRSCAHHRSSYNPRFKYKHLHKCCRNPVNDSRSRSLLFHKTSSDLTASKLWILGHHLLVIFNKLELIIPS